MKHKVKDLLALLIGIRDQVLLRAGIGLRALVDLVAMELEKAVDDIVK